MEIEVSKDGSKESEWSIPKSVEIVHLKIELECRYK